MQNKAKFAGLSNNRMRHALHHAKQKRLARLKSIEADLILTERFSDGDVLTPSGNVWVDESAIFAIDIAGVPETPDGPVMEIGGASRGFGISFGAALAGQLIIRCGAGSGGDILVPAINASNDPAHPNLHGFGTMIVEVRGNSSTNTQIRYWFVKPDGTVIDGFDSDSGVTSGNWAGGASGVIGAVDATVPNQVDTSAKNFTIKEVRYYRDQLINREIV